MAEKIQAAPGELELVRQFVNTNDIDDGIETFASPEDLQRWLAEHGLEAEGRPGEPEVERAIELREALRAMLLANSGEPLDPGALDRLNESAAQVKLAVRFEPDGGSALAPDAAGIDGALGAILAIVYRSRAEETWPRLKACRADTCQWAFYDTSRNRSAHWCTMRVCGNRAKARTYRRRHKPHDARPFDVAQE
jgi:predicted RNA-binding Zn ribbon-like protein